ncbi:MAG: polymer-forming cytoskeletal protein [Alphaproteobacteria bacterium]|nr:polymer-forming cytoskeletal protein [Alphaproteobacteria bacterium]
MFSRNKNKDGAANHTPQPRAVPSIISVDLKITGDLESTGEIQVDGEITGDIRSRVLLVGESAVVTGEIIAETVRVHGKVVGQIKSKFVNLAKTAHVVGDILHENLSIQEGAFLEGHITHLNEHDLAKATAHPKPADVKPTDGKTADGKPAGDRVNLVVKSGAPGSQQSAKISVSAKENQPEAKAANATK